MAKSSKPASPAKAPVGGPSKGISKGPSSVAKAPVERVAAPSDPVVLKASRSASVKSSVASAPVAQAPTVAPTTPKSGAAKSTHKEQLTESHAHPKVAVKAAAAPKAAGLPTPASTPPTPASTSPVKAPPKAAKTAEAAHKAAELAEKAISSPAKTVEGGPKAAEPSANAMVEVSKSAVAGRSVRPVSPARKAGDDTPGSKAASAAKRNAAITAVVDPFDELDSMSEKQFLASQRVLLLAERATYTNQAIMLRAEADQLAEEMEPGDVQFDDESGEGTTVNVERERDLAMSAQAVLYVEDIDRALARMDAKAYGICEGCHKPIVRPRLQAMPFATQCVSCKNGGLSRR